MSSWSLDSGKSSEQSGAWTSNSRTTLDPRNGPNADANDPIRFLIPRQLEVRANPNQEDLDMKFQDKVFVPEKELDQAFALVSGQGIKSRRW